MIEEVKGQKSLCSVGALPRRTGCGGGGSSTHIDMSTFFDVTSFQSTSQNTAWQRRRAHMHKHSLFLMYHILTTSGGDPCIKSYSFFPSKFVQLV